jgi:hypothetical protein
MAIAQAASAIAAAIARDACISFPPAADLAGAAAGSELVTPAVIGASPSRTAWPGTWVRGAPTIGTRLSPDVWLSDVIRAALDAYTGERAGPRPNLPLFASGEMRVITDWDEAMRGFGEV